MKKFVPWKSAAALIVGLIAVSGPAKAECLLVTFVTVTESTALTFPTLEKPSAGSVTYTIPSDGSGASGTATVLYGTASRGEFVATRFRVTTDCTNTTYDIQNVSTGDAGITLSDWKGYIDGAEQTLPYVTTNFPNNSANGGTPFYIGATATITSSASTGSFSPSFDVVCNVQ